MAIWQERKLCMSSATQTSHQSCFGYLHCVRLNPQPQSQSWVQIWTSQLLSSRCMTSDWLFMKEETLIFLEWHYGRPVHHYCIPHIFCSRNSFHSKIGPANGLMPMTFTISSYTSQTNRKRTLCNAFYEANIIIWIPKHDIKKEKF